MSEVRQCDTCKRVFSLLEDDWAYSNTELRRRGDDGRIRHENIDLHTCGNCVKGMTKVFQVPETQAIAPPRYDPQHVADLEKELGIGDE